ncbi:MAG: aminopeptidase [Patescibacteria group bacterium]|nr:M1 family metallopeptidase [Candidatus Saccharibacteria bacterium]MDQ5962961.1 aminopeptidase [Patescibacteria group bacterium]
MKSVARLYNQFQPEHYDLALDINEKNMTFTGSVAVRGKKVGRPSKRLTFHVNGLKVTFVKVARQDKKGSQDIILSRINHQKTLNEVRLHSDDMLFPGQYSVVMDFEGKITDGMTGIYPCYFKDGEQDKKLFATQFESHHAREAFPCIDEPEAKATFQLTLTTGKGVTVLSNTPEHEQKDVNDDRLTTTFEPTPKMSTYLLAFAYGDIHSKEAQTKSGVAVRSWATTAQPANSLDFALDAAVRSIEFFEEYFGVPYPLAKADHIALPDFSSGAMENWGLITYRERVFLDYPESTSQSTREYIALVVAHETSHQWFGNLVTMKWWNNLWLNESFANMMEYECVDALYPEWNIWNTFIASEGLAAFRRDALDGVQSVQTDVHHPDEISSLFDGSIVYAKGGRLLYMLKSFIGEEAFRKGLSLYFSRHAYGNTTGDDLWNALSETSGTDVANFMNPWIMRPGFPVVHVEQNGKRIKLTQEHFCENPSKADSSKIWPIPTFSTVSIPSTFVKAATEDTFPENGVALLNQGGRGHYLVNYKTAEALEFLRTSIRSGSISEADRLLTLNGSSMLARAGYARYDDTLSLLESYGTEASEPVWDIISMVAGEVRRFIDVDPALEPRIKQFSARLAAEQFTRLDWEAKKEESGADAKLRATIIGLSAYGEDASVLAHCKGLYAKYLAGEEISAELRAVILAVAIKQQISGAFEALLERHDQTVNSELKSDLCDALTATQDTSQAVKLLSRLKDKTLVKPQDVDRWLVYLLRNRFTRDTAWQWMVDNWQWLEDTFQHDKSYDYLPRYAASCVNTDDYAQKFHDLFDSKINQPLLKRNIELGAEEIANRVDWLKRDLSAVQKYFADLRS